MTDKPAPVVPIREGVRVSQPRSLALLEFVAHLLANFEDADQPDGIAVFIYGQKGRTNAGADAGESVGHRALCALASVELADEAVNAPEADPEPGAAG